MTPSTPPKGSLEELFRHHLLESEAAAVRPRPQVWEQIDNSLLLAQNEKYRRRLLAYRWAMAASLLLASLAGGGWWRSQQQAAQAPSLAQATRQLGRMPQPAGATSTLSTSTPSAIDQTATLSASATSNTPGGVVAAVASYRASVASSHAPRRAGRSGRAFDTAASPAEQFAFGKQITRSTQLAGGTGNEATPASPNDQAPSATLATLTTDAQPTTRFSLKSASDFEAGDESAAAHSLALAPTAASSGDANVTAAEGTLASRWASLDAPGAAALPAHLGEVALAPAPPLELARGWQYGLAYATSAYQPNIDWARPATAYPATLGANSARLSSSAAAEYRDNLRAGLGQRLSVWAARRLGNGRWTLRTGLDIAQNTATSASSVAFTGEPVADVSYTQAGFAYSPASNAHRLQRTSFRYRSVSVPAELRYSNPLKTGFSLYGRVGAFVSALLNVRSEVADNPEATRTYTLQSASTPYRPLSGGLRGGAGMQYRPAGHQWSFNFGPVAELGILSLNADPGQDFWGQQRPYSFGLEAGVELGRGFKIQ
jgi:hypothetical protein